LREEETLPRRLRRHITAAALAVACTAATAAPALAAPDAPGAPGQPHTWAPADKQGFGSARGDASNVAFTLRSRELTEVYYPDLSTPGFRGLEFAITDGRTFVDRETGPGVHSRVTPLRGSLAYRQTTWTRRWKLTKTWITDPRRPTVLARVGLRSLGGRRLQAYVLADPAPGDDGNDDHGYAAGGMLVSWDDAAASAVAASGGLRDATSGYLGTASDPWAQLGDGNRIATRYTARAPGNVVQAARTRLTGLRGGDELTLAIGFGAGAEAARKTAARSLVAGFGSTARRYAAGWGDYLHSLKRPPKVVRRSPRLRRLYEQSVMVLLAHEDKLNPGASVASPTMPWVWGTLTLEDKEISGPYHLVWPRDFYHVATAQKAAGDDAAVKRLVDYLWRVQKPDGSWWQNTRVNGMEYWTNLQLDEVALPVVLAWWLGRDSAADWEHVRRAAEFILARGPVTEQERWENQDGWSPNTIATQVAALVCAADIARRHGDEAAAVRYEAKADLWQASVERWTATGNGPYSPRPYYLRVTKDGNPNAPTTYDLGDNHPTPVDQRAVVDQSFLGLVLFGVKPHDDPVVRNSLAVGDRVLKADTPHGPMWHRFTSDGYGETESGADWDIFDQKQGQTLGRLWPLLSGERGEYDLLAGRDARPALRTIAGAANEGLMLPEQVWDGRPPTGEPDFEAGEGTRSATPLAWTHAQFVRLAWSIQAGEPIERPSVVACRYTGSDC
jgi:glucoamylase